MNLYKYIFSELYHSRRFVILFVLNLSLGFTSFIALELLQSSVNSTINAQSRHVLGADMGISSRRIFSKEELQLVASALPLNHQTTDTVEIFSMVTSKGQSSLLQIKAIDIAFPFYGQILTRPMKKSSDLEDTQSVWVYPEVLTLLNTTVGNYLKIGDLSFRIAAVVTDDAASGISTNMAPRIYMSVPHLKKTNLIRAGSLAWHSKLYKIPKIKDAELEKKRDQIYQQLPTSDIQVFTHKNSSEQMARLLGYLSDFLSLVSLAALFISCIGLTFLLSNYLKVKSKSIAILTAIGFSMRKSLLFYFIQLFLIVVISGFVSILLATLLLPLIIQATQTVAAFKIRLSIDVTTVSLSLAFAIGAGVLLLLPHLLQLRKTNANSLLRGGPTAKLKMDKWSYFAFAPALLLFYFLSVRQMHSFTNGSLFFFCFLGAGSVFYSVIYFTLPWLNRITISFWPPLAWAIKDICRLRTSTVTAFLALSLGLFLVNIVPQIKTNLQAELAQPPESKIPSLFLFDIQQEQVEELRTLLNKQKIVLNTISPLIRARLVAINEQTFDKGDGAFSKNRTREEERESQFRNRGLNLSYREKLDTSETITKGSMTHSHYNSNSVELPEVSLEERFADRLNIGIGDILTFDIQDTLLKGKVTSLRKVRWTSFQPNFFVLLQPGTLDDAPKTFLATIPKISLQKKINMQKNILKIMPNVSLVDVDRLILKLSALIDQMSWALQVMSAFCILVGLSVLLALANDQAQSREWDIGLLKALGTSYYNIAWCFVLQFTFISFFAALCGGILSLVGSYMFSLFLFDGAWYFNWQTPLILLIGTCIYSPILIFFGIRRALQFSARELLAS